VSEGSCGIIKVAVRRPDGVAIITITQTLDIPEDRTLIIKVPETVSPGPHEVVLILSGQTTKAVPADSNAEALMRFAGTIRSFAEIDGLEYQRQVRAEWE